MNFSLVKCDEKYFDFVRQLRTHPENISGFVNQSPISDTDQIKYMNENKDSYFICLYENEPVGFVGVINDDIRVATKPDMKNRGIGKFMINEVLKLYPNAFAKVKINNDASINLFESCGFKKQFIILER